SDEGQMSVFLLRDGKAGRQPVEVADPGAAGDRGSVAEGLRDGGDLNVEGASTPTGGQAGTVEGGGSRQNKEKAAALWVRRPVFASVLTLMLVVIGWFSYFRLGVDRFPKVDFPTITVTTRLPGAAPEELETEVTDKIEEAVNTISGIDELRSTTSEGVSQVFVTFVLDKDINVAAQEVRDRVNLVLPDLPKEIDQPTVDKLDPDAAPVLAIALSAPQTLRGITEYADKTLRRQIESTNGVGQVVIVGGRQRRVNVWLDPEKLRAYD